MIEWIDFRGGLNTDQNPNFLENNFARAAENVLFYDGWVKNTPGSSETVLDFGAPVIMVIPDKGVNTFNAFYITNNFKIFRHNGTEITGAGLTGTIYPRHAWAWCNGLLYISSNTQLIEIDPVSNTYTVQSDGSNFLYLTTHLSRLVCASSNVIGGYNYLQYSVPGNPTDFSGSGSGFQIFANVESIGGIGVINDYLVVLHNSGITVGIPTGVTLPPYNWKDFEQNGPIIRRAIASNGTTCYKFYKKQVFFVASDGIYSYDLNQVTNIGKPIWENFKPKFAQADHVMTMKVVTYPRELLILAPRNAGAGSAGVEQNDLIFIYDIKEQTWSTKRINFPGNFYQYSEVTEHSINTDETALAYFAVDRLNNLATTYRYVMNLAYSDKQVIFYSKFLTLSSPDTDAVIRGIWLVYENTGEMETVVAVYCHQANESKLAYWTGDIGAPISITNALFRTFVPLRLQGNYFTIGLSFQPADQRPVKISSIGIDYDIVGETRNG